MPYITTDDNEEAGYVAGSKTSRKAAQRMRAGSYASRILDLLRDAGERGMTRGEIQRKTRGRWQTTTSVLKTSLIDRDLVYERGDTRVDPITKMDQKIVRARGVR